MQQTFQCSWPTNHKTKKIPCVKKQERVWTLTLLTETSYFTSLCQPVSFLQPCEPFLTFSHLSWSQMYHHNADVIQEDKSDRLNLAEVCLIYFDQHNAWHQSKSAHILLCETSVQSWGSKNAVQMYYSMTQKQKKNKTEHFFNCNAGRNAAKHSNIQPEGPTFSQ